MTTATLWEVRMNNKQFMTVCSYTHALKEWRGANWIDARGRAKSDPVRIFSIASIIPFGHPVRVAMQSNK